MTNEQILKRAIEKYDVSRAGIVSNRSTGLMLKPATDRKGYEYVSVYVGNYKTKKVKVHRMLAAIHIPNPDDLPQINHKDGDRKNNTINNLEWCTTAYNVKDGFNRGRLVWNKGKVSKKQIYRECKKCPRLMFWLLTRDDFRFAKAFWGEEYGFDCGCKNTKHNPCMNPLPEWQYHLQQMVLEKDRIKYLEKFLND